MSYLIPAARVVLLLALGYCAYSDIRSRTVPLALLGSVMVCGVGFQIAVRDMDLPGIIAGCGVGGLVIAIAFLSGQKIGYGDGMILVVTGVFLGFEGNIQLLLFSLGVSMVVGIGLLIFKRLNRKTAIPFAPCILCGYIGVLAFG